MVSRYNVEPAGAGFGQGLAGIGAIMRENRERAEEQKAQEMQRQRQADAQSALLDAWQSKDPNIMMEATIKFPELSQIASQGLGLMEDFQKKEAAEFARQVMANPERAGELAERRIQLLSLQGRDPSHTMDFYENYLQDPDAAIKELEFGFASIDREGYKAWIESRKTPERVGVNVSGRLVDRSTGEVMYEAPPEENFNQPFLSDGSPNPAFQEYQMSLRASGAPSTTINMPATEGEASKAFGKGIGDRANERIQAASSAQSQNMGLEQMAQMISDGAATGFGQQSLVGIKNAARSLFGIELGENVGEQEMVQAIGNRLALELRNPMSGLGLPGATSNKDLDFLMASVPGLRNTPQGNALMIDYFVKVNEFKQDVATEQQRIIDENDGVVPNNLDSQIMKFINNYTFLEDSERTALESLSKPFEPVDAAGFSEGQTATGPAGRKIVVRNGMWVEM
jgi:hypothetical protein